MTFRSVLHYLHVIYFGIWPGSDGLGRVARAVRPEFALGRCFGAGSWLNAFDFDRLLCRYVVLRASLAIRSRL